MSLLSCNRLSYSFLRLKFEGSLFLVTNIIVKLLLILPACFIAVSYVIFDYEDSWGPFPSPSRPPTPNPKSSSFGFLKLVDPHLGLSPHVLGLLDTTWFLKFLILTSFSVWRILAAKVLSET